MRAVGLYAREAGLGDTSRHRTLSPTAEAVQLSLELPHTVEAVELPLERPHTVEAVELPLELPLERLGLPRDALERGKGAVACERLPLREPPHPPASASRVRRQVCPHRKWGSPHLLCDGGNLRRSDW